MQLSNDIIKKIQNNIWKTDSIDYWVGNMNAIDNLETNIIEQSTGKNHKINSETIQKGYDIIAIQATNVPDFILQLLETEQFDEEQLVDAIIQVGLFGELKYQ